MEAMMNDLLNSQTRQIFELEQLKECFLLRLHLLNQNNANKSEFEKNEADILRFETNQKVFSITEKIKAKKKELCSFFLLLEEQNKSV
jgi:hypothetical protein